MTRPGKTTICEPKVIIAGPLPPPVHGVSQAIQAILNSAVISREMLLHLDTSDHRSSENLGRVDWQNLKIGLKNAIQMGWLCARHKPRLVYYTLSQNAPALLRDATLSSIARLFRLRTVVQLAGNSYFDIASRRSLAAALIRRSLKKASLVLVLGSSQVAAVQKIARRANVGVAPNGVSIPPFTRRMGEPYPRACHFLHIGYVSEAKGVTIALRALAQVRDGKREIRATFAGEWASPEERDRILGETSRLGLQDLVDFPGIVIGDAKESLLQEADVFLLPSFAEGQPISILEAMAHELPVIATSVGAIPDTVKDGQTGLLVECGDTEGLTSAMEQLIDDSAMRVKMGTAGAARFRERFTLARSHEILRDHFLRVAADAPRAVK